MTKSLDAFVEAQIGKLTLDLLKVLAENAQLMADATGWVVIDAEARAAINALISRIEATGLIATV